MAVSAVRTPATNRHFSASFRSDVSGSLPSKPPQHARRMAIAEYKYLTPEQREHFLQHGWVKIPKAVKEEYLKAFTENVWVRLGFDPDDKSTWTKEKVHFLFLSLSRACQSVTMLTISHVDPHASTPGGSYEGIHAQGMGCDVYVSPAELHPLPDRDLPAGPSGRRAAGRRGPG